MNRENLINAGINYDVGLHRFKGKTELYEKFLKDFPNDDHYSKMVAALKRNDIEEAFKYAHALKSIIGNLSMDDFYDCLFELVEALRNHDTENVHKYFAELTIQHDRVVRAITEEND